MVAGGLCRAWGPPGIFSQWVWLVWVVAVLGYQIPPRLSPKPRPTSCPALRRWASLAPLLGPLAGELGGEPLAEEASDCEWRGTAPCTCGRHNSLERRLLWWGEEIGSRPGSSLERKPALPPCPREPGLGSLLHSGSQGWWWFRAWSLPLIGLGQNLSPLRASVCSLLFSNTY